jgi:hypothetical protein
MQEVIQLPWRLKSILDYLNLNTKVTNLPKRQ